MIHFYLPTSGASSTHSHPQSLIHRTGLTILPLVIGIPLFFGACSATKDPNQAKNIVDKPTGEEEAVMLTAIESYDRGLFSVAEKQWIQFRDSFPASPYQTLAEIKVADSQYFKGDFPAAIGSYEEFKRLHPGHEAVPYAQFQIGNAHLEQYEGVKRDQAPLQNAIRSFEQLLVSSPGSEYSILARRSLDRCRELLAEHEAYVSEFYQRRGDDKASLKRKETLLALYPESSAAKTVREGSETIPNIPIPTKLRSDSALASPQLIVSTPQKAQAQRMPKKPISDIAPLPAVSAALTEIIPSPAIQGIECGDTEGKPVFILYSAYPLSRSLIESSGDQGTKIELIFDTTVAAEADENSVGTMNCSIAGITVEAQNLNQKAVLHLSGELAKDPQVIGLDRPKRVALIFQGQS